MKLKHCLIIDDDPDDQEIFIMCVKKISEEIECRTSNTGIEAIEILTLDDLYIPDYIFLDVNMPKMNGVDCLRILKKMDRLKDAKIFMYSTTSDGSVLNESRNLGASDFIIKPSKTVELKEKLSRIFSMVSEIPKI